MNRKEEENILSNITLLFVEDEEIARLELSKYLKRRVGRLIVGKDGVEGLELLKKYNPDMVVTDLKMPGKTGLEMLKEARENGYDGGVIINSALSDSETILEAVDLGIVKYIVKPVDTNKLLEAMNELALHIMKQKTGKVIIEDKYILNRDEKKELEDEIKSKVAFFIKKYTGKGPKNIRVFIQGKDINVEAEETLTAFESSIVKSNKNHSLVDYNRKIFYSELKREFEKMIQESTDLNVRMIEAEPNSKKNVDYIKFSFV
ncbi:regulator of RpoS [Andreesenia angusta]|uniref:Regulator of RpoS n=1 Tax=Andreesenia angusta TaxID=39480 RepID=A0A1S1V795_9FIRM|nr:Na-translocating system protein MpsC family protein [Andreesenia angusta]OHW62463.1 regulator of RpoS [Andreesenia angusta]